MSSGIFVAASLVLIVSACGETTSDERVADTMRRTEDIRGLAALRSVPYRFLPADEAFDDLLQGWSPSEDARRTKAQGVAFQRLGLLPLDFDIVEATEWSTRAGVLGYYDPKSKAMTIVANEEEAGPAELLVLAHEHAHALQDQHFDLESRMGGLNDDESTAIDALAEGEATLVMAVWAVKRLGAEDFESLDAADIPADVMPVDEIPPILARTGEFPYLDGLAFVYRAWENGNWSNIDQLWANPPASSEQILHPERYPDDIPVVIKVPDVASAMGPDWAASAEMVMGEMRIGVLLADGEPWDDGGESEAFAFPELANAEAAAGWGGDRLVQLEGPGSTWLVVWQTTWDSALDAREFSAAARTVLKDLAFVSGVIDEADITPGDDLPYPVLVLVASDQETYAQSIVELGITDRPAEQVTIAASSRFE